MTITKEIRLRDFEAWSRAVDTMETLENLQAVETEGRDIFYTLENIFEEQYYDGLSEASLNDILWFETDFIAECLGYSDWETLERKVNGEEYERIYENGTTVICNCKHWVVSDFDSDDNTYLLINDEGNKLWRTIDEFDVCFERKYKDGEIVSYDGGKYVIDDFDESDNTYLLIALDESETEWVEESEIEKIKEEE